jgi:hypothetical protein
VEVENVIELAILLLETILFIFARASLYRSHPFSAKVEFVGRAAGVFRRGILPVHFLQHCFCQLLSEPLVTTGSI